MFSHYACRDIVVWFHGFIQISLGENTSFHWQQSFTFIASVTFLFLSKNKILKQQLRLHVTSLLPWRKLLNLWHMFFLSVKVLPSQIFEKNNHNWLKSKCQHFIHKKIFACQKHVSHESVCLNLKGAKIDMLTCWDLSFEWTVSYSLFLADLRFSSVSSLGAWFRTLSSSEESLCLCSSFGSCKECQQISEIRLINAFIKILFIGQWAINFLMNFAMKFIVI